MSPQEVFFGYFKKTGKSNQPHVEFRQKLVYKSCSSTVSSGAVSQLTLFLGWQVPPAPFISQEHDQVLFALDEIRGKWEIWKLDTGIFGWFLDKYLDSLDLLYTSILQKNMINFCDVFFWHLFFFVEIFGCGHL